MTGAKPVKLLYSVSFYFLCDFKDSHWENTPSNRTEALTKSINMHIWTIGLLNQLFIRDSYTQISKKVVSDKSPFFVIGPLCTPHSICLNFGF